jgi:hypothetical protein
MRSRTKRLNPLGTVLIAGAALVASAVTAAAAPCAPGATPAAGTVGLEFVLDNSTSLENPSDGSKPNDPNRLRIAAAQLGLSQLGEGDTIGVLKFSDVASPVIAPTVLTAANRQGFIDGLNAAVGATSQGTNYEDAFAKAAIELGQMCAAKRAVIFLSDGIPTRGNIDTTNYTTLGVPVYTISLGVEAATRLQTIAQATAGQYYFASDPNVLQDSFTKAVSAARGFNSAGAILVKPGETKDTAIDVPAGTTGLNALASWPLNTFKVTLVSPTGVVIDGVAPPPAGVTAAIKGTSASFSATNPAPGRWILKVLGVNGPATGTNVSVAVSLTNATGTIPAGTAVTIPPPSTAPPAAVSQGLSKVKAGSKLLKRGKALTVTFELKIAGKVTVVFAKAGAKGGARTIKLNGKAGVNKVTIPAKFISKALKRGSYRVTVKPEGSSSQKVTLGLK